MSKVKVDAATSPWTLNTRRITTAGVLSAITIILAVVPNIGYIPMPNISGSATIEHIPTILGAVLEGPIVGMFTGLVFGLTVFFFAPIAVAKDPIVLILPRIVIGLTAWLAFIALRRVNRSAAAACAGLVGSLTNTVLVISLAIWRGIFPAASIPLIIPQAVAEAIIAAIFTAVLAGAIHAVRTRMVRAPETGSREELPY